MLYNAYTSVTSVHKVCLGFLRILRSVDNYARLKMNRCLYQVIQTVSGKNRECYFLHSDRFTIVIRSLMLPNHNKGWSRG